jgi:PAS domain S-box-containing protein
MKRNSPLADLREADLFSQEVIANAGEGIIVYDRDLRYLLWNPFMENLTGIPADEILGKKAGELFPRLHEPILQDLFQEALEGGRVSSPDVQFHVPRTGRHGWICGTYGPLHNSKGEITGVIGVVRDVTDRRLAEQALQYRGDFEKIISTISTEFIHLASEEIDPALNRALETIGRFVKADRSYFFIFSEKEGALSNTHEWCAPGIASQRERCQNMPCAALPWFMAHMREHRIFHVPDVAAMPAEAAGEKAEFEAQEIRSLVCVPALYRDKLVGFLGFDAVRQLRNWDEDSLALLKIVGEIIVAALQRKWTEEALRASEEQLRQSQKMEAVGRLAGGIAHDFNNLLTAIMGYGELLAHTVSGIPAAAGQVQEILKASQRAASLVRQLLAFSRKQVLAPAVLDFNATLRDMETLLRRLVGEAIELRMEYEDGPACVKADPVQMQQVVMNLVVNARDAMPEGGAIDIAARNVEVTGSVAEQLGLPAPGSYVQVTVKDTGCGMDEATQARIFDPFFTTKGPGKGVGLGLSMVYGILQQSKGAIAVTSAPGAGAAFALYLPRVKEKPARTSSIRPPESRIAPGSETVLLVEDEESVRKLLAQMLDMGGYTVMEASNGLEALACLQAAGHGRVRAVVTDVVMPSMGGQELAQRLLQDNPDLPILFISGYTSDFKPLEDLSRRSAFLSKPFTAQVFTAKLRALLDAGS